MTTAEGGKGLNCDGVNSSTSWLGSTKNTRALTTFLFPSYSSEYYIPLGTTTTTRKAEQWETGTLLNGLFHYIRLTPGWRVTNLSDGDSPSFCILM